MHNRNVVFIILLINILRGITFTFHYTWNHSRLFDEFNYFHRIELRGEQLTIM